MEEQINFIEKFEDGILKENRIVSYSQTGIDCELTPYHICNFIQDMGTRHFAYIGADNFTQRNINNIVWMMTKSKIKIYQSTHWGDNIYLEAYVTDLRNAKLEFNYIAREKNKDGKILFCAKQISCPVSLTTNKIEKISNTKLPLDINVYDNVVEGNYIKDNTVFDKSDIVYDNFVRFYDLDYSEHTNNAVFVKFICNCFDKDFIKENFISQIDISYIRQLKEKEHYFVYMKQVGDDFSFKIVNDNDQDIVKAYIETRKR